jgi:glutamine synthetase
VEFRAPDPSSNPYLCFAALLMAGLDGIQNQIDPGDPFDKDLYELPAEEAKLIKQVPGSLGDVLKHWRKIMSFCSKAMYLPQIYWMPM